MNKYILDLIRNNSRSVLSGMTRPQKKAISEVLRGLFTAGKPILRHLAQSTCKTAKKQGEKYAYHLECVDLKEKIEESALKKVKQEIKRNTIIAYDTTDIAKECAKKMEKISKVFDGSKRKVTNGYMLHGVGANSLLLELGIHDSERHTTNQIRRKIITKFNHEFKNKGIWVFDRGNDDKQFFKFLRHFLKVQFIARLRSNRQVVIKKTGVICRVNELPSGRYTVYLMHRWNQKVDLRYEYTLVINDHLEDKEPVRLLAYLKDSYSNHKIVTMYLERWGIENIFKRAKTKFNLEKIRVLNHQKFVNLVALIQFAVNISTITFIQIQKFTYSLISGVQMAYRKFIKLKNLTFNLDSFITYLKFTLKPLVIRNTKDPPEQLNLFSRRQMAKLGSF
jgi:hypothetical protein